MCVDAQMQAACNVCNIASKSIKQLVYKLCCAGFVSPLTPKMPCVVHVS
jgi:hypothetical protein